MGSNLGQYEDILDPNGHRMTPNSFRTQFWRRSCYILLWITQQVHSLMYQFRRLSRRNKLIVLLVCVYVLCLYDQDIVVE